MRSWKCCGGCAVVLLVLLLQFVATTGAHPAQEAQQAAMKLANEGKLGEALPLFKRACRLAPREAHYFNNLGVTQLRLGMLPQAEAAFMEALALHPSHPDARDNLRDARKYMRDNGMPSREGQLLSSTEAQAIALGEEELLRYGGRDGESEDDDFGSELSDEGGAGGHAARAPRKDAHGGSPATAARSPASSAASAFSSPVDLPYDAFLASRGIRHRVRRLPRIHASELWKPQHREFARGQRPYVLLGAVRNASALAAVGRPDFFTRSGPFVERTADFYPANMDDKEVRPYLVPLAEAVRELLAPSERFPRPSAAHPGRYVHFNMRWGDWQALMRLLGPLVLPPNMANTDAWLGAAFDSDAERDEFQITSHWRMLLLGTDGAGMFNHADTLNTASYQMQLAGTKTWHLCHPNQGAYVHPDHDMFHPDYARFPQALQADCFLDMINAGETVFYPAKYWHQTLNTPAEPGQLSIGLTDTLADFSNHRGLKEGLLHNCDKPKLPNINPSTELCAKFPRIFDWWDAAYGRGGLTDVAAAHKRAALGQAARECSPQSAAAECSTSTRQAPLPVADMERQRFAWESCTVGSCDSAR